MTRQMPDEPVPASVLFLVDLAASSRMTVFVRSCSVMPEHGFYELLRRPFPPPPPAGSPGVSSFAGGSASAGEPASKAQRMGGAMQERKGGMGNRLPILAFWFKKAAGNSDPCKKEVPSPKSVRILLATLFPFPPTLFPVAVSINLPQTPS